MSESLKNNINSVNEDAAEANSFQVDRMKRINDLIDIVEVSEYEQGRKEKEVGDFEQMPTDFLRDDFSTAVIQLNTMLVVNLIYEKARSSFGRELSSAEEEVVLTTLDYVFKRVMSVVTAKNIANNSALTKQEYLKSITYDPTKTLSGDMETVTDHDLVHIILAIKLGLDNENSPLPTFMRDKINHNTGEQALLEEAFATMFSARVIEDDWKSRYDEFLINPKSLAKLADTIYLKDKTPLFRGLRADDQPYFSEQADTDQAVSLLNNFIDTNKDKLKSEDLFAHLVLFSQGAGMAENLVLLGDKRLFDSSAEKLAFIELQICNAQKNIDTLISGNVPEEKDNKYRRTVEITRETFFKSLASIQNDPKTPVFVEILLETLIPLYDKAKAQSEETLERLSRNFALD